MAELTDEQASQLLNTLEKVTPVVSTGALTVDLKEPLPSFTEEQSYNLISVLFNLLSVTASHDWDLRDAVEAAVAQREADVPEEKQAVLIDRLYAALNTPVIADNAKAVDAATEYDALFHSARCFTGVRTVHGTGLTGAVIVHNLKIDYFTAADVKSMTIALTESDIDKLERVLAQAKDRLQETRNRLRDAGIRVFNFNEGGGD